MDKKLTESKKAKLGGIGVSTILVLIAQFGLSVTTGGYIVGAIIIANILGQAFQDAAKEKNGGQDTNAN